ncbi:MAG TPA: DNA replication/repair protein RecF [Myxococcaceae bacterium]|nr:DNA replication/repair protein RecF [Myxococcaceae bacterium]
MLLQRFRARDFRNLRAVDLAPSPRATVVVGRNGQGKTNLLEAIYFLCTLRPLRGARLAELVRFECDVALLGGRFTLGGAARDIAVEIRAGSRQASVDGKRAASLEEYFGGVSVVAFTPDDLAVVKGAPEERRSFLDRAVFNRLPGFLAASRTYLRALRSRNRLLREGAPLEYLRAYEDALATAGGRILVLRRDLLEELAPRAVAVVASIARLPGVAYRYAPAHLELPLAGADESSLSRALLEALRHRLPRDQERGFTSVGPHADDLEITIDGRPARAFASQGQARALVLAWKIAEIENLRDVLGRFPLLLLDDVSSELDPERNAFLMRYLAGSGAQVLLTTTEPSLVRAASGPDTLWLGVEDGLVTPAAASSG